MTRIVETTLDIRFSADGEARAVVDSNATGDVARQADLVCFAHAAARAVGVVGNARGLALVQSLSLLADSSRDEVAHDAGRLGIRIGSGPPPARPAASTRVVARFLSARRQPRMFFAMKSRSSARSPLASDADLAAASLYVAFAALLARAVDERHRRRLVKTTHLLGRLIADAAIRRDNEFDVALAAADMAWRSEGVAPAGPGGREDDLRCPNCGNDGSAFEFRLWPSEEDAIRKCGACGAGVWLRRGQRVQQIDAAVWEAMELLRETLADEPAERAEADDGAPRERHGQPDRLLADLKRVFAQNSWPFAEVRDAPVLVSDLSGVWGTWKFYAQVVKEHDVVLFYSICPLRVPEELRVEAAHFLTRANYGLATGNFELDFDDGEIRYKTVVHVDGDLSSDAVKRAVRANGIAMETYLPGIGAVITGTAALPALERRVDA
jgi:hypothetical protein